MNFKFENDLENNKMLLTLVTEVRTRVSQPHVVYGWKDVQKIVNENYSAPETHTLGECLNPLQAVDNNQAVSCTRVWKFNLTPIQKTTATKRASKVTKTRTTKAVKKDA